jgi:transcriptional regulator with GAF, ATPase, and Fis domain
VLSRQLDEFESKNKAMLNAARRAREQEEANQQALINQQLADNAIALAQASSAQALGMPDEHLQSNLQDVGAHVLPTNRQPPGRPIGIGCPSGPDGQRVPSLTK